MGYEVSFDPVGGVVVHIGHLEEQWDFWAFRAADNVSHVSHTPGLVCALDDHRHSCFDVVKDRIWVGWLNRTHMASGHINFDRMALFKADPVRPANQEMFNGCLRAGLGLPWHKPCEGCRFRAHPPTFYGVGLQERE